MQIQSQEIRRWHSSRWRRR